MARLLVFAATLLLVCSTVSAQCTGTTCSSCITGGDCGWCGETETCSVGSSAGPDSGTCATWAWTTCTALPCDQITDCTTCASADNSCGWCSSSATCMAGTASGSDNGNCQFDNDGTWLFGSTSMCTSNACSQQSACADCTNTINCGWCTSTGVCAAGNSNGAVTGSCTTGGSGWLTSSGSCSSNACTNVNNCESCNNIAQCGWCSGTGECMIGNSNGPASGYCSGSWDWGDQTCPGSTCDDYTTCSDCNSQSSCGWCSSSGTCSAGTSSGPNTGYCSDWSWGGSTCCDNNYDCDSCVATANCGWCDALGECNQGTSTGPNDGFCSDWAWTQCSSDAWGVDGAGFWTCYIVLPFLILVACLRACLWQSRKRRYVNSRNRNRNTLLNNTTAAGATAVNVSAGAYSQMPAAGYPQPPPPQQYQPAYPQQAQQYQPAYPQAAYPPAAAYDPNSELPPQ